MIRIFCLIDIFRTSYKNQHVLFVIRVYKSVCKKMKYIIKQKFIKIQKKKHVLFPERIQSPSVLYFVL